MTNENQFVVDSDAIFESIINASASAAAREEASPLVDAWLEQCAAEDAKDLTIGVEVPFWLQIAPQTFVVGTLDRIARDAEGVFGCEWKSAAKRSPARGSFPGWGPERWYDDIKRGHQLGTYGAALVAGTFIGLPQTTFAYAVPPVRILVRAVSKSNPPEIWPTARGAFVEISAQRISATLNAYRVVAEQIRAARRTGLAPWQLTGHHCTKFGKYRCGFYDSCLAYAPQPTGAAAITSFSPGSQKAAEAIFAWLTVNDKNVLVDRDDLVILSASTLGEWMQCPEKYRRSSGGRGEEASDAQEVGSVLHEAVAQLYKQMMGRK